MKKIIIGTFLILGTTTFLISKDKTREELVLETVRPSTEKISPILKSEEKAMLQSTPINEIQRISKKIFKNEDDQKKTFDLLKSAKTKEEIARTLNSLASYQDHFFQKRMAALDALYEGIQTNDREIQEDYLKLAEAIFSDTKNLLGQVENLNIEKKEKEKIIQDIKGDKVEILMIIKTISRSTHENFIANLLLEDPDHKAYINKALAMEKIYEVSI